MIKTAMICFILDKCINNLFDPIICRISPESLGLRTGKKYNILTHRIRIPSMDDPATIIAILTDVEILDVYSGNVKISAKSVCIEYNYSSYQYPHTDIPQKIINSFSSSDADDIRFDIDRKIALIYKSFTEEEQKNGFDISAEDIVFDRTY